MNVKYLEHSKRTLKMLRIVIMTGTLDKGMCVLISDTANIELLKF